MRRSATAFIGAAAVAATSFAALVPTPAGFLPAECVHNVPAHSSIHRRDSDSAVVLTAADGSESIIPKCDFLLSRGGDKGNSLRASRNLQLPPDYDGWTAYTAAQAPNSSTGFSVFTAMFTTPATLPATDPAVLYIFPGLQNINWVPLVDPMPTAAFDIIQPVLQYPADAGDSYSVKSWWVTLDVGAIASQEVALQPGDVIFGNMTRTGAQRWFIDSVNTRTGEHTSLSTPAEIGARVAQQPWAYITLECYGCTGCDTYPAGDADSLFTQVALTLDGAAAPSPGAWTVNPQPDSHRFCHEGVAVVNASTQDIFFNRP